MDSNRIKEIQQTTAYPNSTSVMVALNQVWNECEQENNQLQTRIKELEVTIENMKAISFPKEEVVNGITSVDYTSDNETELDSKYQRDYNTTIYSCKKCNTQILRTNYNYCPNCGRKIIR